MRRTSLFDVNQRFCLTMGRMRASATALRKRFSRLSCDSPGRRSTLISVTPFRQTLIGCLPYAPAARMGNNTRAIQWRALHYTG